MSYDAFISYGHKADGELAPALQSSLQRLSKPWYRRKPFLRVLRDTTSFGASGELEDTIRDALDQCGHLVLLLSPDSAASHWTNQELEHWLATKDSKRLTIVVTGWQRDLDDPGSAPTDLGTFDWEGDDLPPALRGALREPLVVDLRWATSPSQMHLGSDQWRDGVAQIAAGIRGQSKDELVGELVAMKARARILTGSILLGALILLLAIGVSIPGWFFAQQAEGRAKDAQAGAEAAAADALQLQLEAETAQASAEEAAAVALQLQTAAETAQAGAELAADDAFLAQRSAETAQAEAEGAAVIAEQAQKEAETARADADLAAEDALVAQRDAEMAQAGAEEAAVIAEQAQRDAETAQADAELAAEDAVRAQQDAETAQADAELAAEDALRAQRDAETAQAAAKAAQTVAETAQAAAETAQAAAETAQAAAVRAQLGAEAETDRQLAIGESVRLATASTEQLPLDPGLASLLARAAVDATSQVTADAAGDVLSFGPGRSSLLAAEAVDASQPVTASAHAALYAAASSPWRADLGGPDAEVNSAQFSTDGTRVVTSSEDGTAKVWSVGGRLLATLEHGGLPDGIPDGFTDTRVSWGGFSPDGSLIVTTRGLSDSGAAWVWGADDLAASTGTPLATLPHDGSLLRAEFNSAGTHLVTVSNVGSFGQNPTSEARLWDVRDRGRLTPLATLPVNGGMTWAGFSPDGTRILTTGFGVRPPNGDELAGAAHLWDATGTGPLTPLATFPHDHRVESASFRSDSDLIVTSGGQNAATVWDLDDPSTPVAVLPHAGTVQSAEFNAAGDRIVTASTSGTGLVWRWDAAVGQPSTDPPVALAHGESVATATFSRDGTRVLTAGDIVKVWDVEHLVGGSVQPAGSHLVTLRQKRPVEMAQFNGEGTLVVTATGAARIWEADGQLLSRMQHDGTGLRAAEFSSDGQRIAARGPSNPIEGDAGRTVRVWEVDGRMIAKITHDEPIQSAHFGVDGTRLVVASSTSPFDFERTSASAVRVWNPDSADLPLAVLRTDGEGLTSASFSPDGTRIVTAGNAGSDDVVRVWNSDLSTPALTDMRFEDGFVISAEFAPDRVVVRRFADPEGTQVWDLGGTLLATLDDSRVGSAVFNRDGTALVTARFRSTDDGASVEPGVVHVWDLDGGGTSLAPLKPRASLPHLGNRTEVTTVAFSPDGTLILTATRGESGLFVQTGVARLWDGTESGTLTPIATLPHDGNVMSASFSHDGTRIVTTSDDNTARVWLRDGSLLATLPHDGNVTSAAFSSDDTRIVTTADGDFVDPAAASARVWESFDISGLGAVTEGRLGARDFTTSECIRFAIQSCKPD